MNHDSISTKNLLEIRQLVEPHYLKLPEYHGNNVDYITIVLKQITYDFLQLKLYKCPKLEAQIETLKNKCAELESRVKELENK